MHQESADDIITVMRSGTQQWLEVAESDYQSSLYLFQGAHHPQALYFMCQAIEKVLKAAQIEFAHKRPRKIHQLETLAREAGLKLSQPQCQFLEDLSKDYGRVRYADYGKTLYNTKAKVGPLIKKGQEIYLWILAKFNHR